MIDWNTVLYKLEEREVPITVSQNSIILQIQAEFYGRYARREKTHIELFDNGTAKYLNEDYIVPKEIKDKVISLINEFK